jgi:hypothetical protein
VGACSSIRVLLLAFCTAFCTAFSVRLLESPYIKIMAAESSSNSSRMPSWK